MNEKNPSRDPVAGESPAVTELYDEPKMRIDPQSFRQRRRKIRRKGVLAGVALALAPAIAFSLFCYINRETILRQAEEGRNQAAAEKATLLSVASGSVQEEGKDQAPPFAGLTVFGTDGGDDVSHDPLAASGRESAFAPIEALEFEEEGADQAPWGHPVVIVEGRVVAVLESQEDYDALRERLMDPYTQPIAGGKPWKRGFANQVEVYYQADSQGIVSVEEAYALLAPVVSVRLREQVYQEREIPFETRRLEDSTLAAGTVRVESEGEPGVRQEVYEVVSINGVEKERNLLGTRVITPPVTRVETVGTGAKSTREDSAKKSKKAVEETALTSSDIPAEKKKTDPTPTPAPGKGSGNSAAGGVSSSSGSASGSPASSESTSEIDAQANGHTLSGNTEAFDLSLLPEEQSESVQAKPSATPPPADSQDLSWPSSAFSAFNYPEPGSSWYADSSIGAGSEYPNVNKESSASGQGIAGPAAHLSFMRPVEASISSHFGWRPDKERMHYGTDFAAGKGTPIKASARGTVTWYTQNEDKGAYGKVVEINHGNGFTSIYAHCDSVIVSEGDHVEQGDIIGYVGNTGGVETHLHFEIRHNGIPYNPLLSYL